MNIARRLLTHHRNIIFSFLTHIYSSIYKCSRAQEQSSHDQDLHQSRFSFFTYSGKMFSGMLGALGLCLWYICLSASLISFNKYLIHADRFPFPLVLTAIHMAMTTVLSLSFYKLFPSWYSSLRNHKMTPPRNLKNVTKPNYIFNFL